MRSLIIETLGFFFSQPPSKVWERIRHREVPWQVQFLLYCFCGVIATLVSTSLTMLLSYYVIPAYEGMTINGELISDETRTKNFIFNSCLAFIPTNVVVYFLNVYFVFKPGKLGFWTELAFFTGVNVLSFVASLFSGPLLIYHLGIKTNYALIINTVVAFMVNFLARKYFIFRK